MQQTVPLAPEATLRPRPVAVAPNASPAAMPPLPNKSAPAARWLVLPPSSSPQLPRQEMVARPPLLARGSKDGETEPPPVDQSPKTTRPLNLSHAPQNGAASTPPTDEVTPALLDTPLTLLRSRQSAPLASPATTPAPGASGPGRPPAVDGVSAPLVRIGATLTTDSARPTGDLAVPAVHDSGPALHMATTAPQHIQLQGRDPNSGGTALPLRSNPLGQAADRLR